jgi:hypothetical protein
MSDAWVGTFVSALDCLPGFSRSKPSFDRQMP